MTSLTSYFRVIKHLTEQMRTSVFKGKHLKFCLYDSLNMNFGLYRNHKANLAMYSQINIYQKAYDALRFSNIHIAIFCHLPHYGLWSMPCTLLYHNIKHKKWFNSNGNAIPSRNGRKMEWFLNVNVAI